MLIIEAIEQPNISLKNNDSLNPAQQASVEHYGTPLLVIAGAGSGKTRVITSKIAYLIKNRAVDPENILAITFTKKAAKEMKERVENMLDIHIQLKWILTFHSLCVKILRSDIDKLPFGYSRNFVIYDADDSLKLIKNVMSKHSYTSEKAETVKAIISSAKQSPRETSLHTYMTELGDLSAEVAFLAQDYENELLKSNALDYDDLLYYAYVLLNRRDDIRRKWQKKFQHILVDEYQDTNVIQYELLKHLAGENQNITVVGDPQQAIYAWRGATPENILAFERSYNPRVIKLECNYRSGKKILSIANIIAQGISEKWRSKVLNLWTHKEEEGVVDYRLEKLSEKESKHIAEKIKLMKYRDGYKFSDFAVLVRVSFITKDFEDAFLNNQIPYEMVGALTFYDRMEIKDLLAYLRFFSHPQDRIAFDRIINTPKRFIGEKTLVAIRENYKESWIQAVQSTQFTPKQQPFVKQFIDLYETLSDEVERFPYRTLMSTIEKIGYFDYLKKHYEEDYEDRMGNISELVNVLKKVEEEETPFSEFYENSIVLRSDQDDIKGEDKVKVMTIHAAKGLEFPVVFLPALEDGIFPHAKCLRTANALEEERRLFYVALTRAKEHLYLSSAIKRFKFGQITTAERSRFLNELEEHIPALKESGEAKELDEDMF